LRVSNFLARLQFFLREKTKLQGLYSMSTTHLFECERKKKIRKWQN